jgi:hypothetical protein
LQLPLYYKPTQHKLLEEGIQPALKDSLGLAWGWSAAEAGVAFNELIISFLFKKFVGLFFFSAFMFSGRAIIL